MPSSPLYKRRHRAYTWSSLSGLQRTFELPLAVQSETRSQPLSLQNWVSCLQTPCTTLRFKLHGAA